MKIDFSFLKKKSWISKLISFIILILIMMYFLKYYFINLWTIIQKTVKESFTTPPNTTKRLDPNTTTNNLTYVATTWTPETVYNYLLTQKTNNEHIIYDPVILQQMATQDEADFFLTNGYWPWSQETKNKYMKELNKNTIIRNFAPKSVETDQKIYPEKAIQEIVEWNTREGQFVLNDAIVNQEPNEERANNKGMGIFGFTSGLLNPASNKIIGCRKMKGDQVDEPYLITPTKGPYSLYNPKSRKLDYAEIPELLDGFEYTDGPCNPFLLLNQPQDYSCKFKVKKKVRFAL